MINYISNLAARAALRIAAVVLASLLSVPAFAADFTDGDFTFSANSDGTTCTVTGTSLTSGDLNIPATATDASTGTTYSVTAIGNYAFNGGPNYTGSLTIPNSVQAIGDEAFWGCSGFSGSLTLPTSLQTIGKSAFYNCSGFTGSLVIPSSVKTIGSGAFDKCYSLNGSLILTEGLTEIGGKAFNNCSGFTGSLTIPNSVQNIGQYAFYGCSGFNGSLTIGNSVEVIGESAFRNCSGFTGSLTIPNSVHTIEANAFYGCSSFDGTLTIPEGLTEISSFTFYKCSSFTGALTLPTSLQTIMMFAFGECSGFTGSLTIPSSVQTIGEDAFRGCSGFNSTLTLPNSLKNINGGVFSGCSGLNGTLTIPNSVQRIGNGAFAGCSGFSGKLTIPNSVQIIDDRAFYECSNFTGSLTIPEGLTRIGESAFEKCTGFDGTLTLPESLVEIGNSAFDGCSGFSGTLSLPEGLTEIGDRAFRRNSGFTGTLTIPNSVVILGSNAFENCSGFTGSLTIGNSVTEISYAAFGNCSGFTGSLTIPNSVQIINDYAFAGCSGFTGSLTIGNSVKVIRYLAFQYCSGFTGSLTLPESLTSFIGSPGFAVAKFSKVIAMNPEPMALGHSIFSSDVTTNSPLIVPVGSGQKYRDATYWKDFSTILEGDKDQKVEEVAITPSAVEIRVGDNISLSAIIKPANAGNPSVTWSSSDLTVATVDAVGIVCGIAKGQAIITATTTDGSNLSANCQITVNPILVEGITLNLGEADLIEGESVQLNATVKPDDATDKTVIWTSSNEAIATVDATGLVKGIAAGSATITASASDGSDIRAHCLVTVKPVPVTGITLNLNEAELDEGESLQLTATVIPENAADKTVSWTSDNEAVAMVFANGKVAGIAPGTATITGTTANGLKATCTVTVKAKVIDVASITLNVDKAELVEGTTTQLTATITPDNATDKSVTWTSSDEAVATVNANGLVTAVAAGSATITATTSNGMKATCAVTVTAKQSGIEGIEGDSAGVRVDGNAIIAPEGSKVYDLIGREVTPTSLTPGIYIVRIPGGKAVKVRI